MFMNVVHFRYYWNTRLLCASCVSIHPVSRISKELAPAQDQGPWKSAQPKSTGQNHNSGAQRVGPDDDTGNSELHRYVRLFVFGRDDLEIATSLSVGESGRHVRGRQVR